MRKTYIYNILQCLKADSPTSVQGLSKPDVSDAVPINEEKESFHCGDVLV